MNEFVRDEPKPGVRLCLDCGRAEGGRARCPRCSSPRLFDRDAARGLNVAHLDCDAFYASVEKRDDPSLEGRPVIIGGGRRGVVATACYLARTRGVRSAMPMFKALKACPDAVILKPNMAKYREASLAVRALMEQAAETVEPISIDEAYLDFGARGDAVDLAARLARTIKAQVGITVSIGLGPNKFVAKLASELDKPEGFSALTAEAAQRHLADKPARALRGVGAAFAERLAADGLATVEAIRRAGAPALVGRYGAIGAQIFERAWARDDRPVAPPAERKSVSAETTFANDIAAREALHEALRRIALAAAKRAERAGVRGRTLTLKLKRADHSTLTRSVTLSSRLRDADKMVAALAPLLDAVLHDGPFRLLGVGLGDLAMGETPTQAVLPLEP